MNVRFQDLLMGCFKTKDLLFFLWNYSTVYFHFLSFLFTVLWTSLGKSIVRCFHTHKPPSSPLINDKIVLQCVQHILEIHLNSIIEFVICMIPFELPLLEKPYILQRNARGKWKTSWGWSPWGKAAEIVLNWWPYFHAGSGVGKVTSQC